MAEVHEENHQVSGRVREQFCLPCTRKDKTTVASVFCYDCENYQCKQCADVHNVFDVMKGHKMAKAGEIMTKTEPFDIKGLDKCKTHGQLFDFICKDHDKLCCSRCAIINHRECHNVVEIQNVAVVSEERSSEIRSNLVVMKELCDSAVMHWKSAEISLRDSVKGLPEKINNVRTQMNKKFDDLLQDVEEDSTAFMKLQLVKGSEGLSKCDGLAKRIQSFLKFLDEVSLHGSAVQKFIVEREIQQQVQVAQKEVEHECDQLEIADISFKLNETSTIKHIIEGNDRLGTLKTETDKVTIDHVRGHRPVNLELVTSIHLKKSKVDESESVFTGVDFLPDGRLLVIDNHNATLLVFNDCLEKTGFYKLSYYPLSVVAVSEDTIAITSVTGGNHQVECLHVSKSSEITNITTYNVRGKYNSICKKDDDHFIVGAFDDIQIARILSLSGEEKDLSVKFHSKRYHYAAVSCTYINERDEVIFSDRDEHSVYIYDVIANSKVVVKDSRIQKPTGVAVGPMNCIFICSTGTDSIVQITPTGVILSSHKYDMKYPFRVCVSKDKTKLAVLSDCIGKNKLQVFKIN